MSVSTALKLHARQLDLFCLSLAAFIDLYHFCLCLVTFLALCICITVIVRCIDNQPVGDSCKKVEYMLIIIIIKMHYYALQVAVV